MKEEVERARESEQARESKASTGVVVVSITSNFQREHLPPLFLSLLLFECIAIGLDLLYLSLLSVLSRAHSKH